MKHGVVKWFSAEKGYGYIIGEDGQDIFVHYTGINADGFKCLDQGMNVEYSESTNNRGRIAVDVTVVG